MARRSASRSTWTFFADPRLAHAKPPKVDVPRRDPAGGGGDENMSCGCREVSRRRKEEQSGWGLDEGRVYIYSSNSARQETGVGTDFVRGNRRFSEEQFVSAQRELTRCRRVVLVSTFYYRTDGLYSQMAGVWNTIL
jgi:hypothetical protein